MNDTANKPPSLVKRTLLKLWEEPKFRLLLAAGSVLAMALFVAAWQSGVTMSQLHGWFDTLLELLAEHPAWLLLAIAILPALPIPVSPMLILAGIVFIPKFGAPAACTITFAAMLVNLIWTYWLAATVGRNLVEKLFAFLEIRIPKLSEGDAYRLVLVMRVTPGFPFFVQNLLLGFLHIPFRAYVLISSILIALWTVAWMVSAGALFSGKSGIAIAGISLLVVISIITGVIRKKMANKVLDRQG